MAIKRTDKILFIILTLLWLSSLARLSGNLDYWFIDILSHFPLQYALLAFIILLAGLWRRAVTIVVPAVLLLVFNLSVFVGPGKAVHASVTAAGTFNVYSANLHVSNDDLSGLVSELGKMDPEMVLLLEVTPQHRGQLESVIREYPYHIQKSYIGEREIGFIFLSKFKVFSSNVTWLSDVCNVLLEAKVEIGNEPVMFYGLHARRPDIGNFAERKEQFLRLAADIKEQKLPVIIAGDFNTTPYAPIFRQFTAMSGLRDSREGFGWQPSWPTFFPPLWIPIDHILVSPEIQVYRRATGSYIGSDHYPVFAELAI